MPGHGIGASVLRKEDERFLRGHGQYVADFFIAGMREVAFVRSTLAHGRIRHIQVPQAHKHAVFSAKDLTAVKSIHAATTLSGCKHSSEPILATENVSYVGELVAMCIGSSRAEAEDIAASVVVDYEELEPVVDMLAARQPNTPLVHQEWGDNVFIEFIQDTTSAGAIDQIARSAPIKVTREIRTSRQCMVPIEGRGIVAHWDARLGYLTIVSATQMPHIVQRGVAECLGLHDGAIRVISPDVGGGFGYKGLLCREEVALAWLALRDRTPVRWVEDCRERLSANANCREHHYRLTAYADRDGRLLALDCAASVDAGAYSVYPISAVLEAAQVASLLPGPYDFQLYRCRSAAVATNKCPRGVARSGVCLAMEVTMDAIARAAALEPYEVRLRNLVRPDQMPFCNVVKKEFDGGDYPQCLRRAVAAIDLAAVRERQRSAEPDARLTGAGFSIFCEQGAMGTDVLAGWGRPIVPGYEQATVRLTADGDIEIRVGTHSHGQGHETTLAQVAHEILGLDFAHIKVLQGDTLSSPFSTGTWGSRAMVMGGGAVAVACRALAERVNRIGAWLLQSDPADARVIDGKVEVRGASVTLREITRAWYLQPQNLPPDVDHGGLEVTMGYRPARDSGTFSYAAHAAVVAVDASTGEIEILDYVVVEDGGKLVNPMIVDGQVRGGTAQGIGTCLFEAMPFDARGQPLASSLLDYFLPSAIEVPNIRVLHMETPSPHTEFGIKGIGEGGAVGPPAAIVCAVNDALAGLGAEVHDLPLMPHRVLEAIAAASRLP